MAILTAMASTVVNADGRILRKYTGSELRSDRTINAGKLEDLWEKEAALAEWEDERLLQMGGGMSFPAPTRSPVRTPAPAPSTPRPTPASATFRPTMQPTMNCLMGRTPTQYLQDELSLITDPIRLLNPSTPQGRAFLFMTEDPTLTDICSYPTIAQRYGLATFYFSTNGADWDQNTGWLGTMGECDWFGVSCQDGTFTTDLLLRK
jgi:hypothetical protein